MGVHTADRLSPETNLVLIGYRACGKTAVGAQLARRLNRPFVDLDQVLVEEAGQSIADIVARFGWQEFRRREKELVARYGKKKGLVLAPGGGAVLDPDNVTALKERGIIIWLTADPDTIQKRLAQDQTTGENRPSLTGADTLREVEKVLKEREPLYQQAAHIIVDTTHQSIDTTTNQILAAVGGLKDG